MWENLDEGFIECGYVVCYDHIERVNDFLLFDDDGNQCYIIHSNGYDFSETGRVGTFTITPLDLAGMIQEHSEYEGGPIRLLSCYAGSYEQGAAQQLASYLQVPVVATMQAVYVDQFNEEFLSLAAGYKQEQIDQMKRDGHILVSDEYQAGQWLTFEA